MIEGERTGATISVPSTGDVGNTDIGVLSPDWRPPFRQVATSGTLGRGYGGFVDSSGRVAVSAMSGTADETPGRPFSMGGTYMLG